MPKVSVYLPDELYARAREHGLALSSLTQAAVEQALATKALDAWLREVLARPSRRVQATVATEELMDAVDEDFAS